MIAIEDAQRNAHAESHVLVDRWIPAGVEAECGIGGSVGDGEPMIGSDAPTNKLQAQTNKLRPLDMSMPELEPVTMSEVGTKLDLARAYMDMGDPEGARSILEEVVEEGSASQKQEASRLIESLPG